MPMYSARTGLVMPIIHGMAQSNIKAGFFLNMFSLLK